MLPDIKTFDLQLYSCLSIFFFGSTLFFLRKQIWNIFDPLLVAILYISLNVSIVAYFFILNEYSQPYFYYIMLSLVAFVLGFRQNLFSKVKLFNKTNKKNIISVTGPSRNVTVIFLIISFLFSLIAQLFFLINIGFGIITGDVNPDIVKVTVTQGGFGIFRHLSIAGGLFFLPLIAHAYFIHRLRLLSFFLIGWFLMTSIIFSFSKAGFFFMMFDIGIIAYYYKKTMNIDFFPPKRLSLLG